MTAEYSKGGLDPASDSDVSASAGVTIQVAERDGRQFIVVKEQHPAEAASQAQRIIEIPAAMLPELKRAVAALEENFGDERGSRRQARQPINFAHESEREFARILDFYHIAWQYEPRTFPIEWDAGGQVLKSFTPDFYLPEHGLYIELTTLKQPLVTKKNRKVRKLRELYPDVNIKILYGSDYRKLIEKFAGSAAPLHDTGASRLGIAHAPGEPGRPDASQTGIEEQPAENKADA
ncbi:MAG: hypothetical protein ACLGJB_27470 [Blastocatellia bacterium]